MELTSVRSPCLFPVSALGKSSSVRRSGVKKMKDAEISEADRLRLQSILICMMIWRSNQVESPFVKDAWVSVIYMRKLYR